MWKQVRVEDDEAFVRSFLMRYGNDDVSCYDVIRFYGITGQFEEQARLAQAKIVILHYVITMFGADWCAALVYLCHNGNLDGFQVLNN